MFIYPLAFSLRLYEHSWENIYLHILLIPIVYLYNTHMIMWYIYGMICIHKGCLAFHTCSTKLSFIDFCQESYTVLWKNVWWWGKMAGLNSELTIWWTAASLLILSDSAYNRYTTYGNNQGTHEINVHSIAKM